MRTGSIFRVIFDYPIRKSLINLIIDESSAPNKSSELAGSGELGLGAQQLKPRGPAINGDLKAVEPVNPWTALYGVAPVAFILCLSLLSSHRT